MEPEKRKKIIEKIIASLIAVAVLGGIAYYMVNNNEYSTQTMANDAKELVNTLLKDNNLPMRCVKISNLPDETLALKLEYDLIAELDNGEHLRIRFRRFRENGKTMHEVKILP